MAKAGVTIDVVCEDGWFVYREQKGRPLLAALDFHHFSSF
jgi:hypothetical protein